MSAWCEAWDLIQYWSGSLDDPKGLGVNITSCWWTHNSRWFSYTHMEHDYWVKSSFCSCHDRWVVVTCAKLWFDRTVRNKMRGRSFTRFQSWAHKPFVKWVHGVNPACCIIHTWWGKLMGDFSTLLDALCRESTGQVDSPHKGTVMQWSDDFFIVEKIRKQLVMYTVQ